LITTQDENWIGWNENKYHIKEWQLKTALLYRNSSVGFVHQLTNNKKKKNNFMSLFVGQMLNFAMVAVKTWW